MLPTLYQQRLLAEAKDAAGGDPVYNSEMRRKIPTNLGLRFPDVKECAEKHARGYHECLAGFCEAIWPKIKEWHATGHYPGELPNYEGWPCPAVNRGVDW